MNVVVIAREDSSRYPKKHLHLINGKPLLSQIFSNIKNSGGRPILCTGAHDENLGYVALAMSSGTDFYCEEDAPSWDVVSRHVNMADSMGIEYWIEYSGDCPFIDVSLFPKIWARLIQGDVEQVVMPSPHSTAIPERSATGMTAKVWRRINEYYDIDDHRREAAFTGLPVEWYTKATIGGTRPQEKSPIKTSVDWPMEGAIADMIVRYLGYWPKTDDDIERVYTEVTKLVVDGSEEKVKEEI